MLKQLLFEINKADYVSRSNLAVKLDRPVPLVEEGFAELVRLGYLLEDTSLNCNRPCGRCPYTSMCQKEPLKTWTITEKGRALLENYQAAV